MVFKYHLHFYRLNGSSCAFSFASLLPNRNSPQCVSLRTCLVEKITTVKHVGHPLSRADRHDRNYFRPIRIKLRNPEEHAWLRPPPPPPTPSSQAVTEGVEVWPWLGLYGTLAVASVNHKTLVLKIISGLSLGLSHDLLSEEYSCYFCLLRSSYVLR